MISVHVAKPGHLPGDRDGVAADVDLRGADKVGVRDGHRRGRECERGDSEDEEQLGDSRHVLPLSLELPIRRLLGDAAPNSERSVAAAIGGGRQFLRHKEIRAETERAQRPATVCSEHHLPWYARSWGWSRTALASIRRQDCVEAEPSSKGRDCGSSWNRTGVACGGSPVDKRVEVAAATCGFSLRLALDSHDVARKWPTKRPQRANFLRDQSASSGRNCRLHKGAGGARQP